MERYRSTKHSADVAKLLAMGAGPGAGEYEENTRNGGFGFRQRRFKLNYFREFSPFFISVFHVFPLLLITFPGILKPDLLNIF